MLSRIKTTGDGALSIPVGIAQSGQNTLGSEQHLYSAVS
jgi:hypothetical protein